MSDIKIVKQGKEKNITWKLTEYGVFMVSGQGAMPDWSEDVVFLRALTPWYRNLCENKIKKLVIENGITTIGIGAFDSCLNLEEVILPETIVEIKKYAFHKCEKLSKINIPQGVKCIGDNAFAYEIPSTVECIEKYSFFDNKYLKTLYIPPSVKYIDRQAFLDVDIEKFEIDNKLYEFKDGILWDNEKHEIIWRKREMRKED